MRGTGGGSKGALAGKLSNCKIQNSARFSGRTRGIRRNDEAEGEVRRGGGRKRRENAFGGGMLMLSNKLRFNSS